MLPSNRDFKTSGVLGDCVLQLFYHRFRPPDDGDAEVGALNHLENSRRWQGGSLRGFDINMVPSVGHHSYYSFCVSPRIGESGASGSILVFLNVLRSFSCADSSEIVTRIGQESVQPPEKFR
jgi:hypothetical protein